MRTKGIGPNNLGMSKSPSKMMASPTKQVESKKYDYTKSDNYSAGVAAMDAMDEYQKENKSAYAAMHGTPEMHGILKDLEDAKTSELRTARIKKDTRELKKSSTSGR